MTQKWLRYRQASSLGNLTDVKIRNPLHWIPFALHGKVVGPEELDTQLHSQALLKGLFTIFFLSFKSHILDSNGVWYK